MARAALARASSGVPVPWGLFVSLGLYGLAVVGYVYLSYWRTPEYQAAAHFQEAVERLGPNRGRAVSREQLLEGYEHLLEAARLMPEAKPLHDQVQELQWVAEERRIAIPEELRRRAEAVAAVWHRIETERQPTMVVGVRDRGWAPDQLLAGPGRVVKWSVPGALLIVVAWAYRRFGSRRGGD